MSYWQSGKIPAFSSKTFFFLNHVSLLLYWDFNLYCNRHYGIKHNKVDFHHVYWQPKLEYQPTRPTGFLSLFYEVRKGSLTRGVGNHRFPDPMKPCRSWSLGDPQRDRFTWGQRSLCPLKSGFDAILLLYFSTNTPTWAKLESAWVQWHRRQAQLFRSHRLGKTGHICP